MLEQETSPLLKRPPRTVASFLPILTWLPKYNWARSFPRDAAAGLALAALMIPEAMGYAGVAGVPVQVGLYAAVGAVLAYAITGGTSILVVGPASAVAALTGSLAVELSGGDLKAETVVVGLAIGAGIVYLVAGILRFGWIVNFISHSVLEAFIAALSISIIVSQMRGLFGVEVDGESAIARFFEIITGIGDWQGPTVAVGIAALVGLVVLRRVVPRVPGSLVVVALAIAASAAFDFDGDGIAQAGEIPKGLPALGLPSLGFTDWLTMIGAGIAVVLVGFSEGYAAASSVADEHGEVVDPDQELFASGTANVAAGVFGGLPVSGSLSKTSAAEAAGSRSQVANLVAGMVVVATLLFLGPIFKYLPEPVLSAVVIAAVLSSADPRKLAKLWAINRLDFAAAVVTFVLVLAWETLPAMAIGVTLSIVFMVRRASFPDVVELLPGEDGVYGVDNDDSHRVQGVAVVRFEAPLLFANTERLSRAVANLLAAEPDTERIVVDAEMVTDLDATGVRALEQLDDKLKAQGIEVNIARCHRRALVQIQRSGLDQRFEGRIFASMRNAVDQEDPIVFGYAESESGSKSGSS